MYVFVRYHDHCCWQHPYLMRWPSGQFYDGRVESAVTADARRPPPGLAWPTLPVPVEARKHCALDPPATPSPLAVVDIQGTEAVTAHGKSWFNQAEVQCTSTAHHGAARASIKGLLSHDCGMREYCAQCKTLCLIACSDVQADAVVAVVRTLLHWHKHDKADTDQDDANTHHRTFSPTS